MGELYLMRYAHASLGKDDCEKTIRPWVSADHCFGQSSCETGRFSRSLDPRLYAKA